MKHLNEMFERTVTNPDTMKMIRDAVSTYEEMTPQQRREMHDAQRRSWVIGNMMLDHPDMSRECAENIFDRVV